MTAPPPSPPIRVVINAIHARAGGGVTYLANMLPLLAVDARLDLHLILIESQVGLFGPVDARVRVHVVPPRGGLVRLTAWEQFALPRMARALGADVLFSPANYGCFLFPRNVILLRNAVAVARAEPRLAKKFYWAALAAATFLAVATASRVIAVSRYARSSLTPAWAVWAAAKTTVIPHGVEERFRPDPGVARENFILVVADIYIQKNLLNLARAVGTLRGRHPGVLIRIAGERVDEGYAQQVEREVRALGLAANVEFLGRQTPEAILDLYRRCQFLVFPSTAETFGNPLVEAMACATPIACSNTAAAPEVVGDAALPFDPFSPAQIAGAMDKLMTSPELRAGLAAKGLARSRLFSWGRTARATADVLVAAAGSARP